MIVGLGVVLAILAILVALAITRKGDR